MERLSMKRLGWSWPHGVTWTLGVALLLTLWLGLQPERLRAATGELFFSEYIEGSSNNKALEIYNGTGAAVDLAAGGYSVQMFFNGSTTAGLTINLAGTVADGDVFVLAQSAANATILAQADQTNGAGWFNGDDAVVLRKNGVIIDAIGQVGNDPGTEWGSGLTSTADNTLRRKVAVCAGDTIANDLFDPAVQWDGFANDTFGGLGSHLADCGGNLPPQLQTTSPADNATGVDATSNIALTFSEPVTVVEPWAALTCNGASVNLGLITIDGAAPTGPTLTGTEFVLDPAGDLPAGASCTLQVTAASVTDSEGAPLPADVTRTFTVSAFAACGASATPIWLIQGSGAATGLGGQVLVAEGVVVGDYQGAAGFNGFYLQEETAQSDNNPATSDGIFIFDRNLNPPVDVNVGDIVRVEGVAGEFQSVTQLSISRLAVCAPYAGGDLAVQPTAVTLPVTSLDQWEQVEGMLVTIPTTLTVTENFDLGRFGEVDLSAGGRLYQPTHVALPGSPEAQQVAANNILRSILLDDGLNGQNPDPIPTYPTLSALDTLRTGDTIAGLTGVVDYRFNRYRVQLVKQIPAFVPTFIHSNPRPAAPEAVGGTLKVASFNVLNYFTTVDAIPGDTDTQTPNDDGGADDPSDNVCGPAANDGCRGWDATDLLPDGVTEFTRQRDKIIAALRGLDADIVGLIEIANDDEDGSVPLDSLVDLVAGLNAAYGSEVYQLITTGEIGTDAIKVALIYKPATVTPQGDYAILDSTVDPRFLDDKNRPVLAQTFLENASQERFTVAVAHLKSKGSACTDVTIDGVVDVEDPNGQGNCNLTRAAAAAALVDWLAADPTHTAQYTGTPDPDVLLVGDLNSYAKEDPIQVLLNAGYTDLLAKFVGPDAYSYVFEGRSGYLDHALSSPSLTPHVTGATEWHINTDEPRVLDYNVEFKSLNQISLFYNADPYRSSDHDPLLVGLCLDVTPPQVTVQAAPDNLWPPNHRMVDVTTAVHVNETNATVELVSATSSQPDNGSGDGNIGPDIEVVNDTLIRLRAERSGGQDRVYTLTYRVTDACGNVTEAATTVTVPANQGEANGGSARAAEVEAGAAHPRVFLPLIVE